MLAVCVRSQYHARISEHWQQEQTVNHNLIIVPEWNQNINTTSIKNNERSFTGRSSRKQWQIHTISYGSHTNKLLNLYLTDHNNWSVEVCTIFHVTSSFLSIRHEPQTFIVDRGWERIYNSTENNHILFVYSWFFFLYVYIFSERKNVIFFTEYSLLVSDYPSNVIFNSIITQHMSPDLIHF